MLAEEIMSLDFDDSLIRKRLEVYNYGLETAKKGWANFSQLNKILDKISGDEGEKDQLKYEFIRGFSDALL